MSTQNVRAFFYKINLINPQLKSEVEDYLWQLISNPANFTNGVSNAQGVNSMTGRHFELRDIEVEGDLIKGSLSALRQEAPSIRKNNGSEVEMNLDVGDTLLEKNYFIYYKNSRILVWQFNMAANHVANFPLMLMSLSGGKVLVGYEHVIKSVYAMDKNMSIEYIDLKVSTPKNSLQKDEVKNLNPTNWSVNPFKIMTDTGARQFSIQLRNVTEDGLSSDLLNLVKDALGVSVTKRLKVKVSGALEPIDMLSERYTYKETIVYQGRNPSSNLVLDALLATKVKYENDQKN